MKKLSGPVHHSVSEVDSSIFEFGHRCPLLQNAMSVTNLHRTANSVDPVERARYVSSRSTPIAQVLVLVCWSERVNNIRRRLVSSKLDVDVFTYFWVLQWKHVSSFILQRVVLSFTFLRSWSF